MPIYEETVYLFVYVISASWVVLTAFFYGKAKAAAQHLKLLEVFQALNLEDMEC